jgi:transcriptional regulator with XRE-family HTH domain
MQKSEDTSFPKIMRDLRQRKHLTVRALAQRINRSVGFVSQIERGLSQPSVEDVHAISAALGVHSMYFLQRSTVRSHPWASRPQGRRTLRYASGVTDQVVSPALSNKLVMLETRLEAGAAFEDHNVLESDEQGGFVLEGVLTLWVNGEKMELQTGDAFQISSAASCRCANTGDGPTRVLWVYS